MLTKVIIYSIRILPCKRKRLKSNIQHIVWVGKDILFAGSLFVSLSLCADQSGYIAGALIDQNALNL